MLMTLTPCVISFGFCDDKTPVIIVNNRYNLIYDKNEIKKIKESGSGFIEISNYILFPVNEEEVSMYRKDALLSGNINSSVLLTIAQDLLNKFDDNAFIIIKNSYVYEFYTGTGVTLSVDNTIIYAEFVNENKYSKCVVKYEEC